VFAVVDDFGEAAMKYDHQEKRDTLPYDDHPSTAEVQLKLDRRSPHATSEDDSVDYSEEAIPERDPAFRLSGGTDDEGPTVEDVSPAVRRYLACRLEQLGMSPGRAAAVASL
jgi:hypothetical protein